ncbi:hypothetical protein [Nitrogeniibacter aestuarii]|uniref:hypothetical protein n=1 Tax=Nitrogeniibacter aestuarii TaxID=2815343 RepID=UPI001D0F6E56|nr:hypothetical protein [Nitrogeniibacter aestuarii]
MPPPPLTSQNPSSPRLIAASGGLGTGDPIAELEVWLGRLPPRGTLTRARMLAARLDAMSKVSYNVRMHLKLLEMIDDAVDELGKDLEAKLDLTTLPLPGRIQNPLAATFGALKLLTTAYLDIAQRIARKWVSFGFSRPMRQAIERGVRVATRRLALAHRAYTTGGSSSWKQLYSLYELARQNGLATEPPLTPGQLTIEQSYAHALLLAAADPTCIAPGDLDRVRFYLQRHVSLTRMVQAGDDAPRLQQEAAGLFVIALSGHPPTALPRLRTRLEPGQWLLDARDLLEKLQTQIDGLRLGVMPARLGLPMAARQSRYTALLETLHEHWSNPRSRGHARTRFLPRTDLVVGFGAIRLFLSGRVLRRRDDPNPDALPEPVHERTSEWGILDESPGGFGLRYLSGQAQHVRVGELVAVRPRERAAVLLGVARRAVNRGSSDFDLGLEVIAASGIPTEVSLPDAFGLGKRQVPVLLIPRLPMLDGRPGLIASIDDVPPGTLITLAQFGQRITLKTGAAVEKLRELEILPLRKS